jgi:ubiquinone/menaquinone biosynthesis C-methylase UbiE
MGLYSDVVVPYCVELSCGVKALIPEREKAVAGLSGRVLEIGFGSGLNLPHYPAAVTQVLAVDPSERARRIGRRRIEGARVPVTFVGLDAERIDAPSASADAALCTFTLCTIPDARRALAEVRRILKPGAPLHFLEHGRAPDAAVARWQDRLNPVQRAVAGGCNVNRDMRALLEAAGFRISELHTGYFPKMPRTHGYLYAGRATGV